MSPIDRIAVEYARRGADFASALERNYQEDGFVYSTPDFFVMGRPINGNAWFIEAFSGDMEKVWSILPWPLPFVAFERFDNNIRLYPMDRVRRLTVPANSKEECPWEAERDSLTPLTR